MCKLTPDHEKVFLHLVAIGYVNDETIKNYLPQVQAWYWGLTTKLDYDLT